MSNGNDQQQKTPEQPKLQRASIKLLFILSAVIALLFIGLIYVSIMLRESYDLYVNIDTVAFILGVPLMLVVAPIYSRWRLRKRAIDLPVLPVMGLASLLVVAWIIVLQVLDTITA